VNKKLAKDFYQMDKDNTYLPMNKYDKRVPYPSQYPRRMSDITWEIQKFHTAQGNSGANKHPTKTFSKSTSQADFNLNNPQYKFNDVKRFAQAAFGKF